MLSSGQQGPLLEAPQRYRALERWLKGVSSYPPGGYRATAVLHLEFSELFLAA